MAFGADTDYFGMADSDWKVQSSSQTPNKSEAQCVDSNGDISSSTMYDSFYDRSVTYNIRGGDTNGNIDFGTLKLGSIVSGTIVSSIAVTTSQTARPQVVISGRSTNETDATTYSLSALVIPASRKASAIGVTPDTITKCTGSNATASVNVAMFLDSDGQEADLDVYGGRIEASNSLTGCTGVAGASADTDWTISSGVTEEQENTSYKNGSVNVFRNILKD